ncbi:hypothetical protein Pta02_18780 [Planobispora takensis]|uniref:Uncharacterized protein n=1 Tax=Planobispora takensis TaxID=1367882 RepID=A0A8J3SV16_9ACTN|nr:hypothetical protein Pta02_18780 [Planobispora takensis]
MLTGAAAAGALPIPAIAVAASAMTTQEMIDFFMQVPPKSEETHASWRADRGRACTGRTAGARRPAATLSVVQEG